MSLLIAFNLEIVGKIFKFETSEKLSAHAQMLYLNCLMQHFKTKKLELKNAHAFEMFKEDITHYKKFEPLFRELHKSGLISITQADTIRFNNVWGKYFDLKVFENETGIPSVKYGECSAEDFKEQMYNSHHLIELCGMKHKVTPNQVNMLLQLFFKEQETFSKKYIDEGEIRKHFVNWIPNNLNKLKKLDTVKSQGKILGR